jgi:hypothetical protein
MCGSFSIDLLCKISLERHPQHALFRQEPAPWPPSRAVITTSSIAPASSGTTVQGYNGQQRVWLHLRLLPTGLFSHSTAMHDFLSQGA